MKILGRGQAVRQCILSAPSAGSNSAVPAISKSQRQLEYMRRRKAEAIRLLGGKCVKCGATSNLEFHHKDPAQKSFTITNNLSYAWQTILDELKKCELRCLKHHLEEHNSTAGHGTTASYSKGCRCTECRRANSVYVANYRAINGRKKY